MEFLDPDVMKEALERRFPEGFPYSLGSIDEFIASYDQERDFLNRFAISYFFISINKRIVFFSIPCIWTLYACNVSFYNFFCLYPFPFIVSIYIPFMIFCCCCQCFSKTRWILCSNENC